MACKPKKKGRPSGYSEELAAKICEKIVLGLSLRKICEAADMPAISSIFKWMGENKAFSEQYARAKEEQAELLADEIIQIADDGKNDTYLDEEGRKKVDHDVVARSRLRVDARKWVASKLKPKKFGDKLQVGGDESGAPVKLQFSWKQS